MKQIFTSLLLLILGVVVVNAQSLSVGGTDIDYATTKTYTSSDIPALKKGTVKWDADAKKLYLDNATIETTGACITGNKLGSNASDRHFIHINGDVYMKSSVSHGIRLDDSYMVIYGTSTATLTIEANGLSGYCGIDAEDSYLDIWSIKLKINASNSTAIWGNKTKGRLSFVGTYADITGSISAVEGFSTMTLNDCLLYTSGAKFVSGTGVTNSSGTVLKSVSIRPLLRMAGVSVRTEAANASGTNWKWSKSDNAITITGNITAPGNESVVDNYGIDDLVIKWEGTPILKNEVITSGSIIRSERNITLSGNSATLPDIMTLEGFVGIFMISPSVQALTLNNACVRIEAQKWGVVSQYTNTDMTIDKSAMIVTGKEQGCIGMIKSCTMKDSEVYTILSPGVAWRQNLNGFGTVTELTKGDNQLWILMPTESYKVQVLGKEINDANMFDIQVDGLTEGKISYDKSSKTLNLESVKLEAPEGNNEVGLFFSAFSNEDYTINLTGENIITTNNDAVFTATGHKLTFTGEGSANCTSKNHTGFSDNAGGTTILDNEGYIRFEGKEYGFWCSNLISQELILKKKSGNGYMYRFKGDKACMHNIFKLTMDDMDFFGNGSDNLAGCYYDEESHSILQNGGAVAKGKWLSIARNFETYPIFVAGVQLNDNNCYGVGSKYIKSNNPTAVTYESSSKVLTLDNANISYDKTTNISFPTLKNSEDNLTIRLEGENTINTTDYIALESKDNTTTYIRGDGKLNAKSGWYALRIANGATLDIGGNVEIDAVGGDCGIGNNNKGLNNETLIIRDKAVVKAQSPYGSVQRLGSIQLMDDIMIISPVGVTIKKDDSYGWGVYEDGKLTDKQVVFADKSLSAIEALELDQNAGVKAIYDAAGRKAETERQGLNIIRMNDGSVRKVVK